MKHGDLRGMSWGGWGKGGGKKESREEVAHHRGHCQQCCLQAEERGQCSCYCFISTAGSAGQRNGMVSTRKT